VRQQRAVRARGRVEVERQVVGVQPVWPGRAQQAQRVGAHDAVQLLGAVFGEMGGDVHGGG
jgi:predicted ATPase